MGDINDGLINQILDKCGKNKKNWWKKRFQRTNIVQVSHKNFRDAKAF